MPVELTFTANDIFDLNGQIKAYCGQLDHRLTPDLTSGNVYGEMIDTLNKNEAKLAKARKTKGVAKSETKTPGKSYVEPEPRSPEPQPEPLDEEDVIEAPLPAESPDLKALIELKASTIAQLQQAFADGKVAKLRSILDTFGEGAKSFPEIEAIKFREIAEAIDKGALR